MRRLVLALAGAAAVWACTEELTAPGVCPAFCPDHEIAVVDTILRTSLTRDSAFRGFVRPQDAVALPLTDLPFARSAAAFGFGGIPDEYFFGTDPVGYPIAGVDSVRLEFVMARPDTAPRNLSFIVYRVAKDVDSTVTYADIAGSLIPDSLARRVYLDTLLAAPWQPDADLDSLRVQPGTGDGLWVNQAAGNLLFRLRLDSADAPYVAADSGRLGFTIAVAADSQASTFLQSSEGGSPARVVWYLRVDSAGVTKLQERSREVRLDTFVQDPPPVALDSSLVVGGAPSARSLLRFEYPPALRSPDSAQVVRATLLLVPDGAVLGAPADSFLLVAYRVQADLGAKSPPAAQVAAGDSSHAGAIWVHTGTADTVGVEVTDVLRRWSADSTLHTTFLLVQYAFADRYAEGVSLSTIRFFPSRAAAFAPALRLTYVPRTRFGIP